MSQVSDPILDKIKNNLLNIDPKVFCQKYLTLDGKPFRLDNNGYKPFSDIYRYIAIKALEPDGKPVVILKGRQVGGTTMAAALEMYFLGSGLFGNGINPPIRIMHAFPDGPKTLSYSKTQLNAMINSSVLVDNGKEKLPYMKNLIDRESPTSDSLQYKQFVGGNHLWIESIGLQGDRVRGKTVDVIFYDEIQDMVATAIGASSKILTKSQYGKVGQGVQVYFGTPKQKGSAFFDLWNNSSQQIYYLGCEKCKQHFPLYTPNSNDWEKIWLYGKIVKCTHCGYEQNKIEAAERGKWISLKNPNECDFIGFHINQLYIPDFDREKIEKEKPGKSAINTERIYQNEVLGEFYQGEASIISQDEIRERCGDYERKFRANIESEENKISFLGIDIGGKSALEQMVDSDKIKRQGQSYSVAVLLTLSGINRLSIDYAVMFKRNDLESKKSLIEKLMRTYNVNLAVCDIGYANDFNQIMQTQYGDKFLASLSTGKVGNHVKFSDDVFPKQIVFERDYWIAELYDQMKKGNIRFPLGDYDKISWMIEQCCNLEIKPTVSRNGDVNAKYVKAGNTDGFFALLNAYIAYKFYVSEGFSINNPLAFKNDKKSNKIPVAGGIITAWR
jgi:hypothetical protein